MKQSEKRTIIGVTGGSGAGKSTLCRVLERLGAFVIDADKIAKEITLLGGSAYTEILEHFGSGVLLENGEINRKALAKIVFENVSELEALNKITHKHVFEEMRREMSRAGGKTVVLDVPLLFSSDFPFNCTLTAAVIADEKTRIERVIKRDGISEEEAKRRIKNQLTNDELKRLADVCIENSGDEHLLEKSAERLLALAVKKSEQAEN